MDRNKYAYEQLTEMPLSELRGTEALEKGVSAEKKIQTRNTQLHAFIDFAKKLVDGGYWDDFDFVSAAYVAEAYFPLASVWFYSPAPVATDDAIKYVLANPRLMFEKLATNNKFKSMIATKSVDDLVVQFKREMLTCFWTGAEARDEEKLWSEFELMRLFPSDQKQLDGDVYNIVLVSKAAVSLLQSTETFSRQAQTLVLQDGSSRGPPSLKPPSPGDNYCQTTFGWMGSPLTVAMDDSKGAATSISLDRKTVCPREDVRGHIARAVVFLSDKHPDHATDLARRLKYDTLLDWVVDNATTRDVFWQMVLIYIQRDIDPRLFVPPQARRAGASKCFFGIGSTTSTKARASNGSNPFSLAVDQTFEDESFPHNGITVLHHSDTRRFRIRERIGSRSVYKDIARMETVDPRYLAAIKEYEKDHSLSDKP